MSGPDLSDVEPEASEAAATAAKQTFAAVAIADAAVEGPVRMGSTDEYLRSGTFRMNRDLSSLDPRKERTFFFIAISSHR